MHASIHDGSHATGREHQEHTNRPPILCMQILVDENQLRKSDKNQADAANKRNRQRAPRLRMIMLGIEILNIGMTAHERGMPKPGGNQKHQANDDPKHNAQEHEEIIERTHPKDGIVRIEKHPGADTENDGKDASRNLRVKTAHMGLIPRDVPRQWCGILLEHGQWRALTDRRWDTRVVWLIGVSLRG